MQNNFSEHINFSSRHIGPSLQERDVMLNKLGFDDLDKFIASVIPSSLYDPSINKNLEEPASERKALEEIETIASENDLKRSLIGLGYYGTHTPSVIERNILLNPKWYTAYTPYQAEISQGRLEALFNFQTLITELTGLPIANASLLDESTAAAEAMSLSFTATKKKNANKFIVDSNTFDQTLSVLQTRAKPLGIDLCIQDKNQFNFDEKVFGVFIQLPGENGSIWDPSFLISRAHLKDVLVTVSIDPMLQVLMKPIGALGADIAVGSLQRFGVPIGFGGPHAAFFATVEKFKRLIPGRLVGQSKSIDGEKSLRLALQTREQHIRREKATSNICTAQSLLAILSSFYAIFHGSSGLKLIANQIVGFRLNLETFLLNNGFELEPLNRFDSIDVYSNDSAAIHKLANEKGFNFRILPLGSSIDNSKGFGICFDELTDENELKQIFDILANFKQNDPSLPNRKQTGIDHCVLSGVPLRKDNWLEQPVFMKYKNETSLMRYILSLSAKDFSLVDGMIPLGSCTMKLNAASELVPIHLKHFSSIHPFAPSSQISGYKILIADLKKWLASIVGLNDVSFQPNAGSQGELAGLLAIKSWHLDQGSASRKKCFIPQSAHGTNPASAVMAGFEVISIDCDKDGNIDFNHLKHNISSYQDDIAALMITYPSTHGVFEPNIREICDLIHDAGALVYMDGANLNAQVGLCKPGQYGVDVCHFNLHKTFCIPHGGGGPGLGPIAVAKHLKPYLPKHSFLTSLDFEKDFSISSAPFGSAGILPISWMYIRMMGSDGLKNASSMAILAANYVAARLDAYFPVLYKGQNNRVAHECILDFREIKANFGIGVNDIAKRLMDYGFHSPTVSWPVPETMMIEPTESESLDELNRFCDAMINIKEEIDEISSGLYTKEMNVIKNAPHTLRQLTSDEWNRPYSRQKAAFPNGVDNGSNLKFWPSVSRIDNAYGDRNLMCSCNFIDIDQFDQKKCA
tara:strand:- start:29374 stop:32295 length:2922 start_codon:yes stop_codon:yes gene_type:complete